VAQTYGSSLRVEAADSDHIAAASARGKRSGSKKLPAAAADSVAAGPTAPTHVSRFDQCDAVGALHTVTRPSIHAAPFRSSGMPLPGSKPALPEARLHIRPIRPLGEGPTERPPALYGVARPA
jgi:hypothetical protein